jgi:DNA-binding NarL/FixJ family response regulator
MAARYYDNDGVKLNQKARKVLIVDDQAPFRQAAALVVEMVDGVVVAGEAGSAEEALELIAASPPDLVLMDINLPGIDGLEATRRITAEFPDVDVLVVSTYESAEFESRALAVGAAGFISKADFGPWSLSQG